MVLPDAVRDSLFPSLLITWLFEGSTSGPDLTNATLSGTITNMLTGVTRAITGTLTVTDGPASQFRWDLSAEDVADEGKFEVQFGAAFLTPPTPGFNFISEWAVKRRNVVS